MKMISFPFKIISNKVLSFRRHIKCWYITKFPSRWSLENSCLLSLDEIIDNKTCQRNGYVFRFRKLYEDIPELRKRENQLNGELDRLEAIKEELGVILYGAPSVAGIS